MSDVQKVVYDDEDLEFLSDDLMLAYEEAKKLSVEDQNAFLLSYLSVRPELKVYLIGLLKTFHAYNHGGHENLDDWECTLEALLFR